MYAFLFVVLIIQPINVFLMISGIGKPWLGLILFIAQVPYIISMARKIEGD